MMIPNHAKTRSQTSTFGEAIDGLSGDAPIVALSDPDQRLHVFWQLCHSFANAHRQGIVHGELEPQRILIGDFGDTLVIDWPHQGAGKAGNPCWRSPEQARGDAPTTRSDVYSLGAAIFHVLAGRPPLRPGSPDETDRRRRAGEIDLVDYRERAKFTGLLLPIVLKALSADAQQRYADADELAEELARCQAGFSVSAVRETVTTRLKRYYSRRWPMLWLVGGLTIAVVAQAWSIWGQQVEDIAAWGNPLAVETFADQSWRDRWRVIEGRFEQEGDRLVSVAPLASIVLYQDFLSGPTAIEFDGEMQPGSPPCDLSLMWSRELDPTHTTRKRLKRPLTVQFGAFDGSYTAIIDEFDSLLAYSPVRPEPGKRHRIRVEIIDDRMTVFIDGQQRCTYRDSFPLIGGHFALLGYYPGKSFGNVRVFSLGVPPALPPTATGDALAQRGLYVEAADEFARVVASMPNSEISLTARYKQGLCLYRAGRYADGAFVWQPLENSRYKHDIDLFACERRILSGDPLGALPVMEHLAKIADPDLQARVLGLWSASASAFVDADTNKSRREMTAWLEFRERSLPASGIADRMSAKALLFLYRGDEILKRYPAERHFCARVLIHMGRPDLVVERYPDQRIIYADALWQIGDFATLASAVPEAFDPHRVSMIQARYAEVPGYAIDQIGALCALLQGLGGEAVARAPDDAEIRELAFEHGLIPMKPEAASLPPDIKARRLLLAGRAEEALALTTDFTITAERGRQVLAIRAAASGDDARVAAVLDELTRPIRFQESFFATVLTPALGEFAGKTGAVEQACEKLLIDTPMAGLQRPRHRALFLLGRIDDQAFRMQPNRQFIEAELALLSAVKAELAGDKAAAVAHYGDWLRLPSWQRGLLRACAEEEFVQWRMAKATDR